MIVRNSVAIRLVKELVEGYLKDLEVALEFLKEGEDIVDRLEELYSNLEQVLEVLNTLAKEESPYEEVTIVVSTY